MKTEKEKMLGGELYDPLVKQLSEERVKTRLLLDDLDRTRAGQLEERTKILILLRTPVLGVGCDPLLL